MNQNTKPRTLFVFPPSTVFEGDPTVPAVTPALGLAYLAAYLEKFNYPVKILDTVAEGGKRELKKEKKTVYGLADEEIATEIKRSAPDIVGISCLYTAYAGDAHRVAAIVKKVNPSILVVFGGAHATIFPEMTLKDKNVDMVVMGEGEEVLLEIVRNFPDRTKLKKISGTVTKDGGKIIRNNQRESLKDLDEIPFPAWHLLPMRKYLDYPDYRFSMRRPGFPLITSRGCPGRCNYCSIHSVWGHTWRGRSPENVVAEIKHLQDKFGIREIFFFDDSLGASKKRLAAICDEIIKRKLNLKWTTPNGIAHWTLDENLLLKMKKAGCYRITFGIESGNAQIRRYLGKPYDLQQAKKMIKFANKIGMWTLCTFIIGFPKETRDQVKDTIKFAIDCETDLAVFYLLCPHPGTQVYEDFKRFGLLNLDYLFLANESLSPEQYSTAGRILAGRGAKTVNFSSEELQEIVSGAYKEFFRKRVIDFLNPLRMAQKMHSWEDLSYLLKISSNIFKIIFSSFQKKSFFSQTLRRNNQ